MYILWDLSIQIFFKIMSINRSLSPRFITGKTNVLSSTYILCVKSNCLLLPAGKQFCIENTVNEENENLFLNPPILSHIQLFILLSSIVEFKHTIS